MRPSSFKRYSQSLLDLVVAFLERLCLDKKTQKIIDMGLSLYGDPIGKK